MLEWLRTSSNCINSNDYNAVGYDYTSRLKMAYCTIMLGAGGLKAWFDPRICTPTIVAKVFRDLT